MQFLLWCFSFLVGIVFGLFLLGQTMLALSFGMPSAIRLRNNGLLLTRLPVIRYAIFAFIFLLLFSAITIIWYLFFTRNNFLAYMVGSVIGFFLMKGRMGNSPDNIKDFYRYNSRFFESDTDIYDIGSILEEPLKSSAPSNELFAISISVVIHTFLSCFIALWVIPRMALFLDWWVGVIVLVLFVIRYLTSYLSLSLQILLMPVQLVMFIVGVAVFIRGGETDLKDDAFMIGTSVISAFNFSIFTGTVFLIYQAIKSGMVF